MRCNRRNTKKEWPVRCLDGIVEEAHSSGRDKIRVILARVVLGCVVVPRHGSIVVDVGTRIDQD